MINAADCQESAGGHAIDDPEPTILGYALDHTYLIRQLMD